MKKIKSLAVIKESYFILSHSFQIITKHLLTQFFSCRWFMQNLHHAYTISFLFTRIRDRLAEKEVVLFRSVGVAALVDLLILCNCMHSLTNMMGKNFPLHYYFLSKYMFISKFNVL